MRTYVCAQGRDRCLEEARLATFTVEECRLCKRTEEHTQTYVPTSYKLPSLHHAETQAYNSCALLPTSSLCVCVYTYVCVRMHMCLHVYYRLRHQLSTPKHTCTSFGLLLVECCSIDWGSQCTGKTYFFIIIPLGFPLVSNWGIANITHGGSLLQWRLPCGGVKQC